jgi:hypothetical protein
MKKLFTMAIVLAGVVMTAGAASAQSSTYCDSYARGEMERLYPTGGGAVTGAFGGAALGAGIAAITGGNVGKGAGIGAGAGLVVGSASWQAKRQAVYNEAYARCMGGAGVPPPQPIYAPVPPYLGTVYQALNVRAGGGTSYAVLFVLQAYEQFQVVNCGAAIGFPGWCYVSRPNGQAGYASQSYIHPL